MEKRAYFSAENLMSDWNDFHLDLSLECQQGSMTCIVGASGSGKSTLLRMLLHHAGMEPAGVLPTESGFCEIASGLTVSWIPQDTAGLCGTIPAFCEAHGLRSILKELPDSASSS